MHLTVQGGYVRVMQWGRWRVHHFWDTAWGGLDMQARARVNLLPCPWSWLLLQYVDSWSDRTAKLV